MALAERKSIDARRITAGERLAFAAAWNLRRIIAQFLNRQAITACVLATIFRTLGGVFCIVLVAAFLCVVGDRWYGWSTLF